MAAKAAPTAQPAVITPAARAKSPATRKERPALHLPVPAPVIASRSASPSNALTAAVAARTAQLVVRTPIAIAPLPATRKERLAPDLPVPAPAIASKSASPSNARTAAVAAKTAQLVVLTPIARTQLPATRKERPAPVPLVLALRNVLSLAQQAPALAQTV